MADYGKVYRLYGTNNDWHHKTAGIKLKQIDSGPERIVAGVGEDNKAYCLKWYWWKKISKLSVKHISCGTLGCWVVSSNDGVFYREGVTQENCAGTNWVSCI